MTNLPQGAVTFLFTDIEGSTRLVKHLRDEYPAVLHQHQLAAAVANDARCGFRLHALLDQLLAALAF
jgi:class 3 adenylate cyclase